MENVNADSINENTVAVQSHLSIMQNVIQRMASNSSSSKTWCITLVSAMLVVISEKGKANLAGLCVLPVLLFCFLDAYYLGLERGFRESYNSFIKKLHSEKLKHEDLFAISPKGKILDLSFGALLSFSVWPFYLVLLFMIYIAYKWIL